MRVATFVKYALTGLTAGVGLVCMAGAASAQTVCSGSITAATAANNPAGCDRVWGDDGNEAFIVLEGQVIVEGDARLTIEDGTILRGNPRNEDFDALDPLVGFPGTLVISRDAFLDARGNPANPIIFTTAAVDNDNDGVPDDDDNNGRPDDWTMGDLFLDDTPATNPMAPLLSDGEQNYGLHGGLVLVGRAPNNLDDSVNGTQGEGSCEGLPVPGTDPDAATFGGNEPFDSSGVIEYFSVRHAGDEIAAGDELNGITFCGIGAGTIVSHVESYANGDDGFEMFGGTVVLDHVIAAFVGDDSIDVDQGYQGGMQFVYTLSTFFNEDDGGDVGTGGSGDRAGEFDGTDCPACNTDLDGFAFPAPNMWASNWTHIGNQPDGGVTNPAVSDASANRGIQCDTEWNGEIANTIIIGQGGTAAIEMDNTGRLLRAIVSSTGDSGLDAGATTAAAEGDDRVADGREYTGGNANQFSFGGQLLAQENHYFLPTGVAVNGRGKLIGAKTNNAGALGGPAANPRPLNPGNSEVSGGIEPHWPGADRSATFKGAFEDADDLWAEPWSALAIGGIID